MAGLPSSVQLNLIHIRLSAICQIMPRYPEMTTVAPYHIISVWALPRSLAATQGIVFTFSSSGYLDGSVHRVSAFASG